MHERWLQTSTPRPVHRNRYTKFHEKSFEENVVVDDEIRRKSRNVFYLNFLLITVAVLLVCVVCCQLSYNAVLRGIKAFAVGLIAVYFSWEVVYFDSTAPGVSPPSPLSPQKSREAPRYAIHTSYLFSVINAVLFTIMIYLWML